jgi:hypothetical protein
LDCHKDDNSNKIPLVRVYQFTLDEVEPEEIEPVF